MTMTVRFTSTMTPAQRAVSTTPGISFDFTGSGILILEQKALQLAIDRAIEQWWSSLTSFRRSAITAQAQSLKISGNSPE